MWGCKRPENSDGIRLLQLVQGPQRRPKAEAVGVCLREEEHVREATVTAPDNRGVLMVNGDAAEPVAGIEDDIVEFADIGCPFVVELVEVEVENAGVTRPIRVALGVPDQEWRPVVAQGEIVL